MQIKTKADLEQEHFEHELLHDAKAAAIVIKRYGLEDEYNIERSRLRTQEPVDLSEAHFNLPHTD